MISLITIPARWAISGSSSRAANFSAPAIPGVEASYSDAMPIAACRRRASGACISSRVILNAKSGDTAFRFCKATRRISGRPLMTALLNTGTALSGEILTTALKAARAEANFPELIDDMGIGGQAKQLLHLGMK